MFYSSVNNQKIKELKRLSLKKYRDKENLFLVEGDHLVKEAYKNGYLKELLLKEGLDYQLDVNTNYISESVLNYLTSLEAPTGIIGVCEKRENSLKEGKILVLDGVQDPGNLGTIIRSSVAFNIDSIIINDKCADPYSDKVIRSSQGMIFKANIIKADLENIILKLKNSHKIFGTKVTDGKSLKSIAKFKKFVIIVGNEGAGVSESLLNLCDENIYIEMNNACESLNVGVATSIILYELS